MGWRARLHQVVRKGILDDILAKMWSASYTKLEQARPWDSHISSQQPRSTSFSHAPFSMLFPGLALVSQSQTSNSWPHLLFLCLLPSPQFSLYIIAAAHSCQTIIWFPTCSSSQTFRYINFHRIKSMLLSAFKVFENQVPSNLLSVLSCCCLYQTALLSENKLLLPKSNTALPSHPVDLLFPFLPLGTLFPNFFFPKSYTSRLMPFCIHEDFLIFLRTSAHLFSILYYCFFPTMIVGVTQNRLLEGVVCEQGQLRLGTMQVA